MSTQGRSPGSATVTNRPPAIGRSAINEFRKARAQFRQERAAAEEAAATRTTGSVPTDGEPVELAPLPGGPSDDAVMPAEPLILLAHGEPLSLALSRRRRDESASVDRRIRLSRMVAREGELTAAIAELAADEMIDLREDESAPLAPVVDLRERAEAKAAVAES